MTAFVIVAGPPASGKSRIAAMLGRELRLPVISKDAIKERLMDHLDGSAEVGAAAFDTQFAIARELLEAGTPFILEGAFFRDQQDLRDLAALGEALVVDVTCDLEELERRYVDRERSGARHPGHRGLDALPDLRSRVGEGAYGVPDVGWPVLRVDTTSGSQPSDAEVVEWIRAHLAGLVHTERSSTGSLRSAWDAQAEAWTRWARAPGHDSYWRFGREAFFAMLPAPGRLTVDVGCGEGRVSRDLAATGHRVVALDGSASMARAAHEASPDIPVLVADGAHLPIADDACDLVVGYMTLQDFDDMPGGVREAARILVAGGRLCIGVVHPINSAGGFDSLNENAPFSIAESYFEARTYVDRIERAGLQMTFASRHHTIESYFGALADAGLTVEALKEVTVGEDSTSSQSPHHRRWLRIPMFLFIRAVNR